MRSWFLNHELCGSYPRRILDRSVVFSQRDVKLSRSRLGGSLKLHLELAADCVRNQGRRSVTLFVYTTRTLTEEATWIR